MRLSDERLRSSLMWFCYETLSVQFPQCVREIDSLRQDVRAATASDVAKLSFPSSVRNTDSCCQTGERGECSQGQHVFFFAPHVGTVERHLRGARVATSGRAVGVGWLSSEARLKSRRNFGVERQLPSLG